MRPLILDLLDFIVPLSVGVLVFVIGRRLHRFPSVVRYLAIGLALAVVIFGGLALARLTPPKTALLLSHVGGTTVLLGAVALFLIGVAWSVPRRSFSASFLAILGLVAASLIFVETSGRLWWRYRETESWLRFADSDGCLQQTSGATCSPTAAVMLLHHYRIRASEGEMAYLAGTSLFGTDSRSIADALKSKVEPLGWRVEVRQITYEEGIQLAGPFIAHVSGQSSGHALLVEKVNADDVQIIDPADGKRGKIMRENFANSWDGTAIYLVRHDD